MKCAIDDANIEAEQRRAPSICPALNARLWLLTKASADEQRAAEIETMGQTLESLARILRDDAKAARLLADTLAAGKGGAS